DIELTGGKEDDYKAALAKTGYPAKFDPAGLNWGMTILILVIMVIYVTMVYRPIAAYLVEMFPTRIRYTSMSLPYHIVTRCLVGMRPLRSADILATKRNLYAGLSYPTIVAVMSFVIGSLFLRETKDRDIGVDF